MTHKRNEGFTLIELIIVIAILAIVLILSFTFFSFGNRSFIKGKEQSSIQHTVRMASRYITDEIRTAKDVVLMEKNPPTFDEKYNYIYVEGTHIIHRKSDGSFHEILGTTEVGPVGLYFEATGVDNILKFTISKMIGEQNFEVNSSVSSLNLTGDDKIEKNVSSDSLWRTIKYSDPIVAPAAIVRLDTLLLNLKELNAFLDVDGDTFVLDVPTKSPNVINLPIKGEFGADISWDTGSMYLGTNGSDRGLVYRRLSDEVDENLTLTATISKEGVEKEKIFNLRIKKLESLAFDANTLTVTVQSGVTFSHQLVALGGNPGYTFTSDMLPEGITLDSNGTLRGIINIADDSSSITIEIGVTLEDTHIDRYGILTPNKVNDSLTINITN